MATFVILEDGRSLTVKSCWNATPRLDRSSILASLARCVDPRDEAGVRTTSHALRASHASPALLANKSHSRVVGVAKPTGKRVRKPAGPTKSPKNTPARKKWVMKDELMPTVYAEMLAAAREAEDDEADGGDKIRFNDLLARLKPKGVTHMLLQQALDLLVQDTKQVVRQGNSVCQGNACYRAI